MYPGHIIERNGPAWQKDEDAVNCNKCFKQFNIWRRKHHCRSCGLIYCKDCLGKSKFKDGVIYTYICSDCYLSNKISKITCIQSAVRSYIHDDRKFHQKYREISKIQDPNELKIALQKFFPSDYRHLDRYVPANKLAYDFLYRTGSYSLSEISEYENSGGQFPQPTKWMNQHKASNLMRFQKYGAKLIFGYIQLEDDVWKGSSFLSEGLCYGLFMVWIIGELHLIFNPSEETSFYHYLFSEANKPESSHPAFAYLDNVHNNVSMDITYTASRYQKLQKAVARFSQKLESRTNNDTDERYRIFVFSISPDNVNQVTPRQGQFDFLNKHRHQLLRGVFFQNEILRKLSSLEVMLADAYIKTRFIVSEQSENFQSHHNTHKAVFISAAVSGMLNRIQDRDFASTQIVLMSVYVELVIYGDRAHSIGFHIKKTNDSLIIRAFDANSGVFSFDDFEALKNYLRSLIGVDYKDMQDSFSLTTVSIKYSNVLSNCSVSG